MDKSEFTRLFHESSIACVKFARRFLTDDLPDAIQYEVFPNSSYDGNSLHEDECVFPEDELPLDEFHLMNADQVIDFLWRDGMVPEWVDLTVVAANQRHTTIELLCCGRFTANYGLLYYTHVSRGPFGVKGPALPSDYDNDNPKRFALFNPREIGKKYQQSGGTNSGNEA
jgi:hypothetical protein